MNVKDSVHFRMGLFLSFESVRPSTLSANMKVAMSLAITFQLIAYKILNSPSENGLQPQFIRYDVSMTVGVNRP